MRCRFVAVSLVTLAIGVAWSTGRVSSFQSGPSGRPLEPQAGKWQTYVLASGSEIDVPPPPANDSPETVAELEAVKNPPPDQALTACAGTLGPQTSDPQTIIEFWNAAPAFRRWTEINVQLIVRRGTNTPLAHRGLALVHASIYDATVAAWHWKYEYHRPRPDQLDDTIVPSVDTPLHPSYPSEHAVIARAAANVLIALFPGDATELNCLANQAGRSRLHARTNYPSDIEQGQELGAEVAARVKARPASKDDKFSASWNCNTAPLPKTGTGFFQTTSDPASYCPEAPPARPPTEPFAGTWGTWVIADATPAPPPPDYGVYGTAAVCDVLEEAITHPTDGILAQVGATRAESESGSDCTDTDDGDGDGLVNDGCAAFEDAPEVSCDDALDNDGDGRINDGCPTVGLSAESGAQCANSADDDLDGKVNDGCRLGESGGQCTNAVDDDGDGRANDGCPANGARNDVVNYWAGAPGNRWNLLLLTLFDAHPMNLPRAARVAAYVNLAAADALYAAWASKYEYWTLRPENAIRQQCTGKSYFNTGFRSVRATPRDPSYTSGLSSVSGAVSQVLAFFFPDGTVPIPRSSAPQGTESRSPDEAAIQAAQSRLFDGTHWRHDNETGLGVGRGIAQPFIDRANGDGANPVR